MPENNDLLDALGAAAYLKINEQTVRRLARTNELPAFKVGGSWRFKKSWLDRWAEAQQGSWQKPHVLVVDDDPSVLETLRRLLEDDGFEVSTAASGAEARELAESKIPDLVFLDLVLPGMNGPAVLKELRRRHNSVPVVILTGHPDSELMSQALESSPITLLAKPASPDQILETARACTNRQTMR